MRYLTAAGVGVLTAIATAILWIVVRFVLPLAVPLFLSRIGEAININWYQASKGLRYAIGKK